MVVGMQKFVLPLFVPHDLQPPVGDDLVSVHVGGSPGTALEHIHRKMFMQFAGQKFITGITNSLHLFFIQHTQLLVGQGSGLFHKSQPRDHVFKIFNVDTGDGKIFHGPQRLYAVVSRLRDLTLTE